MLDTGTDVRYLCVSNVGEEQEGEQERPPRHLRIAPNGHLLSPGASPAHHHKNSSDSSNSLGSGCHPPYILTCHPSFPSLTTCPLRIGRSSPALLHTV